MTFYIAHQRFYNNFFYIKSYLDGDILRGCTEQEDLQWYVSSLTVLLKQRGMDKSNLNFQPNVTGQSAEYDQLMNGCSKAQKLVHPDVLDKKYTNCQFQPDKFYCQNQALLAILADGNMIAKSDKAAAGTWFTIVNHIQTSMRRKMTEEQQRLTAVTALCSGIELLGFSQGFHAIAAQFGPERRPLTRNPRTFMFGACIAASNVIFHDICRKITDPAREHEWLA